MTINQIRHLCGDMMIYLEAAKESIPDSALSNYTAAKEIIVHLHREPRDAVECSGSLYKILEGLLEVAVYFDLDCEIPLSLCLKFANHIYEGVREMEL